MKNKKTYILLVESAKGACDGLLGLIFQHGYEVVVCNECSQANWLLQNQKFAVVVIDQEVNGENGLTVISSIKKNRGHINHKTPFILMSDGLEADLVNRVAGRIDGALLKPFGDSQFIEKVRSVVQAK